MMLMWLSLEGQMCRRGAASLMTISTSFSPLLELLSEDIWDEGVIQCNMSETGQHHTLTKIICQDKLFQNKHNRSLSGVLLLEKIKDFVYCQEHFLVTSWLWSTQRDYRDHTQQPIGARFASSPNVAGVSITQLK